MGEARARQRLGLAGSRPNPVSELAGQRHVLALIDRRNETDPVSRVTTFTDNSAKPGRYASANLRTLYHWDGTMLRRLDRQTLKPHNEGHL